jgi:hypothetical protein
MVEGNVQNKQPESQRETDISNVRILLFNHGRIPYGLNLGLIFIYKSRSINISKLGYVYTSGRSAFLEKVRASYNAHINDNMRGYLYSF